MVNGLASAASTVGLRLNLSKTEVISFCWTPTPEPPLPSLPLIKACSNFTYLGSLMADTQGAFEERRRLAWAAVRSLNSIFCSSAPEHLKIELFKAVVEPIHFYGCESWVTPQSLTAQIDASHRALLRAAINVRWPEVIRNNELYAQKYHLQLLPSDTSVWCSSERQHALNNYSGQFQEFWHTNLRRDTGDMVGHPRIWGVFSKTTFACLTSPLLRQ